MVTSRGWTLDVRDQNWHGTFIDLIDFKEDSLPIIVSGWESAMEKEEPLLGIVGIGESPAAFKGQKVLLHHRYGRVAFYVRLIFDIQKEDFKAIFIPTKLLHYRFQSLIGFKL